MVKQSIENRMMVQYLSKKGYSPTAIARQLGTNTQFVYRWKNRKDVGRQLGSGRPPKLDKKRIAKIEKRLTSKDRPSQRMVAQELGISQPTICRGIKKAGLRPYRQYHKPALNETQRMKRVSFAKKHKRDNWDHVLFVDEKTFELQHHPNRKNDVFYALTQAEVPPVPTLKHPAKVHVAAGVAFGGRTNLHFFEVNMTSNIYLDILRETLLPGAFSIFGNHPFKLLQDSDPKHTSKAVYKFLDDQQIDYYHKNSWPANSPDINIIENVWAMLADAINKNPPSTLRQLKKKLKDE